MQGQTFFELFTEYKRERAMYHAHPNYNSFGEWYDWTMIRFEIDNDSEDASSNGQHGFYANNFFPAKVLCFSKSHDNSIYAVVHCCFASEHDEDGILMECWKKYCVRNNKFVPLLRCVSVDTFETPCFVVEDRPGLHEEYGTNLRHINNGVTLVKPRDAAWPNEFL